MDSAIALDPSSLFVVNATSLVVFGIVYLVTWLRKFNPRYWLNLAASEFVLAAAFVMFSRIIEGTKDELVLPNCLLVVGLAFRWQALRAFFGHRPRYILSVLLVVLAAALLLASDVLGAGAVFGGINVILGFQLLILIQALVAQRHQRLPSLWGLVGAYGVMLASSALRVMQGWMLDNGMSNLLPADIFLNIHLLAAAIHIVASGAFSLSIAYEQGAERLQQIVLRDPLTGLLNRRGLEQELARMSRDNLGEGAVFLIDIDRFKEINDQYGHAAGDRVIQRCAALIERHLRQSDVAARIGGEEFVVVLPDVTMAEAGAIAERLRAAIELDEASRGEANGGEATAPFTVSIGVSHASGAPLPFARLMLEADTHLYQAKKDGRNLVRPGFGP